MLEINRSDSRAATTVKVSIVSVDCRCFNNRVFSSHINWKLFEYFSSAISVDLFHFMSSI